MKKVGERPAAKQAGEPVVNRAAVVHQATPKGSQGGRLSALSWGSVMPAKPAQPPQAPTCEAMFSRSLNIVGQ